MPEDLSEDVLKDYSTLGFTDGMTRARAVMLAYWNQRQYDAGLSEGLGFAAATAKAEPAHADGTLPDVRLGKILYLNVPKKEAHILSPPEVLAVLGYTSMPNLSVAPSSSIGGVVARSLPVPVVLLGVMACQSALTP